MVSRGIFGRYRLFTAPGDGRSFTWIFGMWTVKLQSNDRSRTTVAQGYRSDVGLIAGKPRQARLEIFPGFEHLVDVILVTFVYAEKVRKDREK